MPQLEDVMVAASEAALACQEPDGSFPGGCNGPYADPETPVRTTAHWAITLNAAYRLSEEVRFAEASARAVRYLLSAPARPMGASFFCRTDPLKDRSNGLIGQAWAIEALAGPGRELAVDGSLETAREVAELHPFDESTGLWRVVNVDGSYRSFDLTLNHQLWFASAVTRLATEGGSVLGRRVARHLDAVLAGHLATSRDGRIRHAIPDPRPLHRIARVVTRRQGPRQRLEARRQMAVKEIGYHAFNLYAMVVLNRHHPEHALWASAAFRRAVRYVGTRTYVKGLEGNPYGFPYNPPGFEVAVALEHFGSLADMERDAGWWVAQQLEHGWNPASRALDRGTPDPRTSAARLYEATALFERAVPRPDVDQMRPSIRDGGEVGAV